jgi:5-methylthioadenosine/S-adenosylhomocysteine deaminase
VAAVGALTGHTNIDFLDSVGLTGKDVVLAHGVHLTAAEIQLLARTRTSVCHCPGANLKLGSGVADVPALRGAGVAVGLGADGPPCNNRLSIFHEMSLAATLHSLRHGPNALTAWEVLRMATVGGAEVLHLEEEIGTLEPGKAADVVVVELDDWPLLPDGDPASRLVYGASASNVRHVVVDGRTLVQDHALSGDGTESRIRRRCRAAWQATAARMEERA